MADELYGVKVDYEEAKLLADSASIFQDLKHTREVLDRLILNIENKKEDALENQSLWTSALISYVRCFSTGKRLGLTTDIYKEYEGAIDFHDFIKNMRDKHIAHSVNPFEQTTVALQLAPPNSNKKEVMAVSVLTMKQIYTDIHNIKELRRLVGIALKRVAKNCEEYQLKVLEKGKTLPIESLYKNAESKLIAPSVKDSGKARNQ